MWVWFCVDWVKWCGESGVGEGERIAMRSNCRSEIRGEAADVTGVFSNALPPIAWENDMQHLVVGDDS
jgi:hypothetical protein